MTEETMDVIISQRQLEEATQALRRRQAVPVERLSPPYAAAIAAEVAADEARVATWTALAQAALAAATPC
ncbi:MAG TPA: hypothetical protein VH475_26525 [Tepidisphaeraceae bacterium]|jgi:hypothetical protein